MSIRQSINFAGDFGKGAVKNKVQCTLNCK